MCDYKEGFTDDLVELIGKLINLNLWKDTATCEWDDLLEILDDLVDKTGIDKPVPKHLITSGDK